MPMDLFKDKVALITGGTSGIGRATAIAFAQEGATVVVAGRREAAGQETVAQVQAAGGTGLFVRTDVSQEAEVEGLVAHTLQAFGRLDVAFNNAGIEQLPGALETQTEAAYDTLMAINVKGVWLALKHEIPALLARGGGAIVNNASIAGVIGFPGVPIYVASKHAVVGLTKALALEYGQLGIRINSVCPAAIDTDMLRRFTVGNDGLREQMKAQHPLGRIGQPEEVAAAVIWLCSAQASFITGHALLVDGGFTVQ